MIPKVIHYCWFGGAPLPDLALKCIDQWKKFCPDYKIVEWNENNFNLECCDFTRESYNAKKWAFLSDCARLYIVYHEGGIYLDTDVELVKSLDEVLNNDCFFGEETSGYINTGLGFGAEKGSKIVYELLKKYTESRFLLLDGSYDLLPCPQKNTEPLLKYGYKYRKNEIWRENGVTVYPPEYFCPLDYKTVVMKKTKNTISIHCYNASWHTKLDKIIMTIEQCDRKCNPIEYKIRRGISVPVRVINKIKKLGIKEVVRFSKNKLKKLL